MNDRHDEEPVNLTREDDSQLDDDTTIGKLALRNYKKSLELNLENQNAKERIRKLKDQWFFGTELWATTDPTPLNIAARLSILQRTARIRNCAAN